MFKVRPRRLILRHAVVCLVFALLSLALNRPEVILLSRIGFVTWYPAVGLAAALMLGVSPGYVFLVFLVNAVAGKLVYGLPIISFGYGLDAFAVAGCYGAAAYILRNRFQIDVQLRHRRDVVLYVFVTTGVALIAALIGAACLIGDHSISWAEYPSSAIGWFMGDTIGLLGIAPFLLVHVCPRVRRWLSVTPAESDREEEISDGQQFTAGALLEGIGQACVLLAVLWVMFSARWGQYDHFYLSFIPIIWIAMRQGVRRTVTALLAFNFGVVAAMHAFPPTSQSFAKVGVLMLVLSTAGLVVASEVSERRRIALDLNQRSTYLNSLIENSPLAILVLDRSGRVELSNSAFHKLFLYEQQELASLDVRSMCLPGDRSSDSLQIIEDVFSARPVHKKLQQRRKDGEAINVSIDAVPLTVRGQVRGAYMIYQDISEQIKASEAQRIHAEALDRLVKELKLRTQEMTLLNRMGHLLECSATVDEACRVVANSMVQLCPDAISGSLCLFRSSRNLVEQAIRWGESKTLEPMFAPDACWSLRQGQPHWSEHPGSGISCAHLQSTTTAQGLCVPMVAQGNTLGILYLEFDHFDGKGVQGPEDAVSLRESRQRLAVSVAGQVALSLASLRLRETLHEQSIRDPLTGLYNRRFLEETIERELQRGTRDGQPVSVVLLDLDHFKRLMTPSGTTREIMCCARWPTCFVHSSAPLMCAVAWAGRSSPSSCPGLLRPTRKDAPICCEKK